MKLVLLADVPEQPWRNRGGTTRELLAWPAADGWTLRISVARIDADGPFSRYPGVQRWFTVLHGAGVRLVHAGGERTLRAGDAPWCFDGDDAPQCTLLDGPTEDLNLMLRDGAGRGAMTPLAAPPPRGAALRWLGVFALDAAALRVDGQRIELPAQTLAWTDAPPATLALDAPAAQAPRGWWLTLSAD